MSPEPDAASQSDTAEQVDDIELAYREALKALDAAEVQIGSALQEISQPDDEDAAHEERSIFVSVGDELAGDLEDERNQSPVRQPDSADARSAPRISPREVIEAAMFVGGDVSLTTRRLASLISKDTQPRVAVRIIDQLNDCWSHENRPYEIRLHEGGFRLQLREEFCNLRLRMFGLGPREVRLSPEVLEILAFVAYSQPVTKEDLESTGKSRAMTHVRQLIRLELVEVVRTGERRSDIAYQTADRFLELFGLTNINELPQADIFSFK